MSLPEGFLNEKNVVCFDLDGVIAEIHEDYLQCVPIEGAIETLQWLREQGFFIIIFTGRHSLAAELTIRWLARHDIPYDHIQFNKPVAKMYFDDRAERFTSWKESRKAMEKKLLV